MLSIQVFKPMGPTVSPIANSGLYNPLNNYLLGVHVLVQYQLTCCMSVPVPGKPNPLKNVVTY